MLRFTHSRWYFRDKFIFIIKKNKKRCKNLTCSKGPMDFGIPNSAEQPQMTNTKVIKIRMFIVQTPVPAKSESSGKTTSEYEKSQRRFLYA